MRSPRALIIPRLMFLVLATQRQHLLDARRRSRFGSDRALAYWVVNFTTIWGTAAAARKAVGTSASTENELPGSQRSVPSSKILFGGHNSDPYHASSPCITGETTQFSRCESDNISWPGLLLGLKCEKHLTIINSEHRLFTMHRVCKLVRSAINPVV